MPSTKIIFKCFLRYVFFSYLKLKHLQIVEKYNDTKVEEIL